jgi:hypothetical protein
MKKRKYNSVHVEDEGSISDMLSEESSNVSLVSECESETSVVHTDEWEDVTMGNKKPKAYTFTNNAGPQLKLLPGAEPMDYFSMMRF